MFSAPLECWRRTSVSKRRTAVDWAHEMKQLLDNDYADAEKVVLVCDNLNTHKAGSFYEAFSPDESRRLLSRLEIHYTPIHGSWLNIAECEVSVLSRQCLKTRVADMATLKKRTNAWMRDRNKKQVGVQWRFTTKDARIKLHRLYPKIQN